MNSEQQYIDLYREARQMIFDHADEVMNAKRDQAFEDFQRLGFPSQKVERYKYTDMQRLFAPDYGVNLNRLNIPADPYKVFSCDVPNLSTSLYFMVNDAFYEQTPSLRGEGNSHHSLGEKLQESVVIDSMHHVFSHHSPLTSHLQERYSHLAKTSDDAVTALNTMLAQDGLLVYVPRGVKVEKTVQVINMLKSPFGRNYSPPS